MKRHLLYFLLLPLLAAGCSKLEKSGEYYYSGGEKIYLDVRCDMLLLQFTEGLSEMEKQAIVKSNLSLKPWTYHSRSGRDDWTYDGSGGQEIAVLQSSGRISQSIMDQFRKMDGVKALSYVLETGGHFMGVLDEICVKLKTTT